MPMDDLILLLPWIQCRPLSVAYRMVHDMTCAYFSNPHGSQPFTFHPIFTSLSPVFPSCRYLLKCILPSFTFAFLFAFAHSIITPPRSLYLSQLVPLIPTSLHLDSSNVYFHFSWDTSFSSLNPTVWIRCSSHGLLKHPLLPLRYPFLFCIGVAHWAIFFFH